VWHSRAADGPWEDAAYIAITCSVATVRVAGSWWCDCWEAGGAVGADNSEADGMF